MEEGINIRLLKLNGIWQGYLKYLPASVPAVRDVQGIIEDIFQSAQYVYEIQGKKCLHYDQLQRGIRRRVLKILGNKCIVCNIVQEKNIHLHHIKFKWRTWNNCFGFTILCEDCHNKAHGLLLNNDELKGICTRIMSPEYPEYDSPPNETYRECTAYKIGSYYYTMD